MMLQINITTCGGSDASLPELPRHSDPTGARRMHKCNSMDRPRNVQGMVWYGMVEVCEGAPVAVSGWVLTDRHDVRPCAASSLHRETISVSNIIGGHGNTRHSVGTKLFGLGPTSSTG